MILTLIIYLFKNAHLYVVSQNHDELTIKVLERERDYYRDECDSLRTLLKEDGKNLPKKSSKDKVSSVNTSLYEYLNIINVENFL